MLKIRLKTAVLHLKLFFVFEVSVLKAQVRKLSCQTYFKQVLTHTGRSGPE